MDWTCVVFGSIVLLVAVIGVIALAIIRSQESKEREQARWADQASLEAYQGSLERLKRDPTNADLRRRTLELGRAYSNLTRNREGVTVYDELAIKNDLDAACAGAVTASAHPSPPSVSTDMMRFRIHGAERETGEEVVFEIECATVQAARTKANAAGYLVNRVEPLG